MIECSMGLSGPTSTSPCETVSNGLAPSLGDETTSVYTYIYAYTYINTYICRRDRDNVFECDGCLRIVVKRLPVYEEQ